MKRIKKIRNLACIVTCIMQITIISAQSRTLHGTIVNLNSNKPMQGLKVAIFGSNNAVLTNENGVFEIEIPDTVKVISFRNFDGFSLLETKLQGENEVYVYLAESS